ncbi:MAG: diphosphate--fructose-6-phosphate 1-phosphotransferase [Mobilitalea sp.]
MKHNLLIVHGGGPTAVLNSSLYGVVTEAKQSGMVNKVFAAIGGSEGIIKENFKDLSTTEEKELQLLLHTPGTAIGSSRYALTQEDYDKMPEIFLRNNIKYVLFNGGNGTMDTCGRVREACKEKDIFVVGIPKTIDNDISVIDHAPGFASAAKYIATTTAEVGADVKSLPIHVCVIEAMGRNAGWITAASALARKDKKDAPHLIYLPERPFEEEEFLEDVKRLYDEQGGVVVVASEGLKNKQGESIVPPIFQSGRAIYFGDVSAYLANLVIQKLGIKARSEKPGLCGRSSMTNQSRIDRDEAVLVGREAVKAALSGHTGVMVGIKRVPGEEYRIETPLIPITEVMMEEKVLPAEYINSRGNDITDEFVDWCKPLLGEELSDYIHFNN